MAGTKKIIDLDGLKHFYDTFIKDKFLKTTDAANFLQKPTAIGTQYMTNVDCDLTYAQITDFNSLNTTVNQLQAFITGGTGGEGTSNFNHDNFMYKVDPIPIPIENNLPSYSSFKINYNNNEYCLIFKLNGNTYSVVSENEYNNWNTSTTIYYTTKNFGFGSENYFEKDDITETYILLEDKYTSNPTPIEAFTEWKINPNSHTLYLNSLTKSYLLKNSFSKWQNNNYVQDQQTIEANITSSQYEKCKSTDTLLLDDDNKPLIPYYIETNPMGDLIVYEEVSEENLTQSNIENYYTKKISEQYFYSKILALEETIADLQTQIDELKE